MTPKEIEREYLAHIQPYLKPAMTKDPATIRALEKADLAFWREHDPVLYQRILKTYNQLQGQKN